MSVCRLTGLQLIGFVCSNVPVVLFDNQEISKCLNTLFLLSLYLCFTIVFICDLFIARNDSWMSKKTSTRTKQIYVFTTIEAQGEGLGSCKASLSPPVFHYRTFQGGAFIVVIFANCYVVFHSLIFFF